MSIEIQSLTLDQLDEALRVWEATLGDGFKLERDEILVRMQNGQGVFLVAFDTAEGQIVGVKFGYLDDHVCIGRGIGVLPAYRRQGIATRLVRKFEQELGDRPEIHLYAFGSATTDGIPFHIAMGYYPQALIQFTDRDLRPQLNLSEFTITHDGFNEQHQVYQIFAAINSSQANLEYLRTLQMEYPQVNVQFFFEKTLSI